MSKVREMRDMLIVLASYAGNSASPEKLPHNDFQPFNGHKRLLTAHGNLT